MQFVDAADISAVRSDMEEWVRVVRHPDSNVVFVNEYNPDWEDIHPLDALGRSLTLLSQADIAYFAPGWNGSRGCEIEAACCDMYGIPWSVAPDGDW